MGIRFRKSIKAGPLRINLSKSGIGYSVGTKHARLTKTSSGRTRASVHAGGLSWSKSVGSKKSSHKKTAPKKNSVKKTVKQEKIKVPVSQQSAIQQPAQETEPMSDEEFARIVYIGLAIIRIPIMLFLWWVLKHMVPELRSFWVLLALLWSIPIKPLQNLFDWVLPLPGWAKGLGGIAAFLFGGLCHSTLPHVIGVPLFIVAAYFWRRFALADGPEETPEPQGDTTEETPDETPEELPAVEPAPVAPPAPEPQPRKIYGDYRYKLVKQNVSDGFNTRRENAELCSVWDDVTVDYDLDTDDYVVYHGALQIGCLPKAAREFCELGNYNDLRGKIVDILDDGKSYYVRIHY